MNELLWWFGQNTLAALLMIPCVMLACRLFRDRPAVQHLLWLVILVKFVTPPIVVWPWSIEELRSLGWTQTTEDQVAAVEPLPAILGAKDIESYAPTEEPPLVPINTMPNPERGTLPAIVPIVPETIVNAAQPRTPMNWGRVACYALISIWFAGAILRLANQLRRLVRFARLIHSGTDAPSHLKSEVASVSALLRMKSPASVVVKGFASPFLWCVGAARLAWPESISSPEDVKRSRGIIAHELAHLRRRDHWITWLELGASILWWWNPLFWYVRRQVRETAEMSCDALAIAAHPESRHAYAELLLKLSSQSTNCGPTPVLAVGAGDVASFERRLKMILSSNVSGRLSWRGALTMALLAVLVLPYWSLAQTSNPGHNPDPNQIAGNAGDDNAPLDNALQADREALQRLVRGGKIDTNSLQAMISQVARRGSMDAEFAQLVMSDFEKSGAADGGTIRVNRDLLAVFVEMFELWGEPRWRTQLARRASNDQKDQQNAKEVPPEALSELETQLLSTLVQHAYNADRSNIATFTLAARQLHSPASREFLRDVLRNPEKSGANAPTDPLAPENKAMPAPAAALAVPQTQPTPPSKTAPLESKWKDNIGGGWGDAKFVAAVGLAELNDAEGVEWLLSKARDNDFGIDGSLWYHRHVRDPSGSLRASSRASLTDLFGLRNEPSFEQLTDAWADQKAQFSARPVALILGFNQPQKVVAQAEIGKHSGDKLAAGMSLPPNIEALLDWGTPVDGLRGALMIQTSVQKPELANPPKVLLVLQNVSDKPIRFCDTQMVKNDDVQVREDKRTLYLRDEEGILSGLSSSGGTNTDVLLQSREVVMVDLFYGERTSENGLPISAVMVETILYDPSLTYSVTMNLATAPAGAWSGKLTTPPSRGAALANGSLPKNVEAQELFRYCIDHARLSGDIPGGTMRLLRAKVQYFIEINTGDPSGDPYAKKMQPVMARLEASGDWSQADVATLFDDIAAVTTIPLHTTLDAIREHTLQRGMPLPTSLQNANWGTALAGGLRMAWMLEPRADQVHLGSSLKSRIVIHNSGKEPVAFVTRNFHQPTHTAQTTNGAAVKLESTSWTTIGRPEPYRLHPGEYCEVAAPGIGIGPRNRKVDDWANVRPGTWILADEGDEVQFQPGEVWLTGDHNQTIDADWWLKFVMERVDRESPVPADQDERKLILFRVVQDLFGTSPRTPEADAFYADKSPEALRNLALLLSKRSWLTAVTGSVKSGPTKFKVLPADPNAATRPRIVTTPGRYNVGDELRLEVTRNSNGGSIRNEVRLTWYPQAKDSVPTSISVPVGYNTWSAGWLPGTSKVWVATKDSLRSYDCANPAAIQVRTFDVEQQATAPISSELRAQLIAAITASENPKPVIGPPAATAGDRE